MIADDLLMNVSLIMICQNMPNFALKCIGNANSSKLGVVHYFSSSILILCSLTFIGTDQAVQNSLKIKILNQIRKDFFLNRS